MINYGYFRHRFDAQRDDKLSQLINDHGLIYYAYYFTLLELYGEAYNRQGGELPVKIHQRDIVNAWRKRSDSCDKVMTKLSICGVLVFTKCSLTYCVTIDKFTKYYGSYSKKKPNKIKENKIKYIPPIAPLKNSVSVDDVIQLWNTKMPKHGFEYCIGLGTGEHFKNFLEATQFLSTVEKWEELFSLCANNSRLKGENGINWKMSLTWLVNYDNALKILNGDLKAQTSWLDDWAAKGDA